MAYLPEMKDTKMTAYDTLIHKLDEFIRKYYQNQIIRGVLYSVGLLVGSYLLVALLEYFGSFSIPVRTALFWIFVISALFIVGRFIALPMMHLFKMGTVISHAEAARIVGAHFPEVSDKLLNTLQLGELPDALADNSLLMASIHQRTEALKPVIFSAAVDFRENRKYLRYALPPVALVLLILLTDARVLTQPTERLIHHREHIVEEAPFRFDLIDGSLQVMEGQSVTLRFAVSGKEIPQAVYVEYNDQQFVLDEDSVRTHSYTFRNVRNTLSFRLYASGHYAGPYTLEVIPAPRIVGFTAHLDYPAYIRRAKESVANAGDLTVPEGTRISWSFQTRNTEGVLIRLADSTMTVSSSNTNFNWTHLARSTTSYSVLPVNSRVRGSDSLNYRLQVIADQAPSISVDEQRDSTQFGVIYFTGDVKDDYGFRRLAFHFSKNNLTGEPAEEKVIELPVSREFPSDVFYYTWTVREFGLTPGVSYSYYFEIWDNDGFHGSKSTRSAIRQFVVPDEREIAEHIDQKNEDIKEKLEDSAKDAQKLQKELEELQRQLLDKQQVGWQEKKKLEELLKMQQQLQQQVNEIKQQNSQKNKMEQELQQPNEEILEKQKQLEELMNQVMNPELQKMMEELQRLMEELNKEDLQDQLEKMDLSNEDLEKELDRALEQFRQLEWEQKMEKAIEDLKKLGEKQEELGEKTEKKDTTPEELKKEQEALNKEFEDLKKELDQIEELNEQLENPNSMPETGEQEKEISEEQQKSSEELNKNKKNSASKSQKNAGKKMKEMAQQMDVAMQAGEQEQEQEDMEALRALLENIIDLSFDQEDLMGEFKTIDIKDPKYNSLGQRQRKLKDDAKMVEDSLFALSKRVPQVSAAINREINLINDHMSKALAGIPDRKTPEVTTSQQYVMTSFNNLALMLDEALKQMQQQASCSKPGTGNCEKPGGAGSKPKPSTGQIKKMQDALSKQLEQMKKEGKNKGENKGQDGQMSKQLAEMAAKQAAIRKMMEEKAAELNEDGSGSGNELKEISKEMEKLQRDIVNDQISEESLRRQQDIMIRLLKAENAERTREQDNQRKSNEAIDNPLSNPQKYADYMRRKERETELLRTVPPGLRPYYRDRVNSYFNRVGGQAPSQ